jgi:predicted site-specific integrase-resolvase
MSYSDQTWMNAREAREELRCSSTALFNYRKKGQLGWTQINARRVLYLRADVYRLTRENLVRRQNTA